MYVTCYILVFGHPVPPDQQPLPIHFKPLPEISLSKLCFPTAASNTFHLMIKSRTGLVSWMSNCYNKQGWEHPTVCVPTTKSGHFTLIQVTTPSPQSHSLSSAIFILQSSQYCAEFSHCRRNSYLQKRRTLYEKSCNFVENTALLYLEKCWSKLKVYTSTRTRANINPPPPLADSPTPPPGPHPPRK